MSKREPNPRLIKSSPTSRVREGRAAACGMCAQKKSGAHQLESPVPGTARRENQIVAQKDQLEMSRLQLEEEKADKAKACARP